MEKDTEIIRRLTSDLEDFRRINPDGDYKGFIAFLKEKKTIDAPKGTDLSSVEVMKSVENIHANITFHLSRLAKYAKYYIKDALKDSVLVSGEDFGFLAAVFEKDYNNKSELISYNVHETPSGMEIIKRLVKNNLISERVDHEDRRKKVLQITDKGRAEFFKTSLEMQKVAQIVSGKLEDSEIQIFYELLRKLDHFHETVYHNHPNYNIDQVIDTEF